MRHFRAGCSLAAALALVSAAAFADITVHGTVRYWNGHERDETAGTIGAWKPAANTQVQVENDCLAVGDITTYTDWTGQYKATFKQRFFRPDFNHLRVNIEVRALVRLEEREPKDRDITVACYKTNYILGLDAGGPLRIFPYNGQTGDVYVKDGETGTLNIYVGPKECPDPPAPATPNAQNLRVTSWDYDDGDGHRTTAAIFMTQCCYEAYRFLVQNCADKKELRRSTSIFYPANKSAYIFRPQKGAWIDMRKEPLFKDEEARDEERWIGWQRLRCTMLHEYGHKLMHDVYWTLPKPYPWGQGANPFDTGSNDHDPLACKSEEMGFCEGWADFLPAVLQGSPTVKGERVFRSTIGLGYLHSGYNIEQAWYPGLPRNAGDNGYLDAGGNVAWRGDITGRREWNETEVAAVLWNIYDEKGWEYMPQAEQDKKPADWPAHLMWFERLDDPKLERIWHILKKEPEALNDEDEWKFFQDSFWTFWLEEYGSNKELVHGLKAILHNREMRHTLRPQRAPELLELRALPSCSTAPLAELTVRERDEEDRPFLYYNIAYGAAKGDLTLLFPEDQPLGGTWSGDRLIARIRLPLPGQWDRLIIKVHDSMTPAFREAGSTGGASTWNLSPPSEWMLVYTTGRQQLTSRDPKAKPEPAGHLVATALAHGGGGSLLAAAFVGDPGDPRAELALGNIGADGTVNWSREYVTVPPPRPSKETPVDAYQGRWAWLVQLPDKHPADYAVAWMNHLMALRGDGSIVGAVSYPGITKFTALALDRDGRLLVAGIARQSGFPVVAKVPVPPAALDGPQGSFWASEIQGIGKWSNRQRTDLVVTANGWIWLGTEPNLVMRIGEDSTPLRAWRILAVPPGPYRKQDLFEAHNGHGEGRDVRYRAMTASSSGGSLILGGSYSLHSRTSPAISREALVAALRILPGRGDLDVFWTALLTESPGYGLGTDIGAIAESGNRVYVAGSTSKWGQDEGCWNSGAVVACLEGGGVTWVRIFGRKRKSHARSEYSDEHAHAVLPLLGTGVAIAGSSDSFSHPIPEGLLYHQAATRHPELLLVRLSHTGWVSNIQFGPSPNLGLAPELGTKSRQVHALRPPLWLTEEQPTGKPVLLKSESLRVIARDGSWRIRNLPDDRAP